jgi:hypothetical protein
MKWPANIFNTIDRRGFFATFLRQMRILDFHILSRVRYFLVIINNIIKNTIRFMLQNENLLIFLFLPIIFI